MRPRRAGSWCLTRSGGVASCAVSAPQAQAALWCHLRRPPPMPRVTKTPPRPPPASAWRSWSRLISLNLVGAWSVSKLAWSLTPTLESTRWGASPWSQLGLYHRFGSSRSRPLTSMALLARSLPTTTAKATRPPCTSTRQRGTNWKLGRKRNTQRRSERHSARKVKDSLISSTSGPSGTERRATRSSRTSTILRAKQASTSIGSALRL
mmetsp:Transcript_94731/g.203472  ORF Transcript_94731/g.203472 Transcript_94731/m.203472 type:complete len:208 (-) Transcript_94731:342-965(-)